MRRKSETVLNLLTNKQYFRDARWKAMKVSKEIQGFGSNSPAVSSPSSSSSKTSRSSSFGSWSRNTSSTSSNEVVSPRESPRGKQERSLQELARRLTTLHVVDKDVESPHVWDTLPTETGSFLGAVDGNGEGAAGFLVRSFSNAGKVEKKKVERQLSSAF